MLLGRLTFHTYAEGMDVMKMPHMKLLVNTNQSAERCSCTHKTICSKSKCTPKVSPFSRASYEYRMSIGSI